MDSFFDNSGFLFKLRSRLGRSDYLPADDICEIPEGKGNDDLMFIFCVKCGEYMDFFEGAASMTGKWTCPKCGRSVREQTPYSQLSRENESFYADLDFGEDDDDFDYL